MVAGWTGPAATTTIMDGDEEVIYMVDEEKGMLSEYDGEEDSWKKIIELPELKGAEHIAAGRGRVCVVCANGEKILVAAPARVWVVEPPPGQKMQKNHQIKLKKN